MNPSPQTFAPAVEEQAAYWAARLDGDVLNSGDRSAFEAWLAQAPEHRAALSAYCQLSSDLEQSLPALVAAGALAMPAAPVARHRPAPRLALLGLAAAAALMVGWWLVPTPPTFENVSSPIGQRSAFTLGDGSRVELNAHTSLRFEITGAERRVRLAGGEALFVVARDPSRPFIVETPAGSVRVTGTTFNVSTEATAARFEVTVVEGAVEVRPGTMGGTRTADGPFSLAAGDYLVARPEGVSVQSLSAPALEDALAWRRGLAVFNDVPLIEAVARLARYHGRNIVVHPALAQERVGGRFSLDDFSGFLAGMETALGLDLKYDRNGAVFLNPRRAP